MTGKHGSTGSQGSADPPERIESEAAAPSGRGFSSASPAGDAADTNEAMGRVDDWNGDRPSRATAGQEPREPAPGDANRLSDPKGRPNDRRESSL